MEFWLRSLERSGRHQAFYLSHARHCLQMAAEFCRLGNRSEAAKALTDAGKHRRMAVACIRDAAGIRNLLLEDCHD
ncbi:hypothetical protein AN401_02655 [Zobellella denitrificans]|uniref:Uncharacterized protein n=2 Tax=Zobellella denitrificans TaxID=347534 RepID=A0A291HL93_9GAMM|nr:hypothetical protein AN401_02655 [Zobellella denitrificans]